MMELNWIAKTNPPRLSWGYNGEGAQQAHDAALYTAEIENCAVLLRGVFCAKRRIIKATASVCGLGFYCLYVNGRRCGGGALAPLETNYRKRVLYDEADITGEMSEGENVFGIELGCGRYSTPKKYWGWRARWHGDPMAALYVEITYDNGEKAVFKTDEGWKCAHSPIGRNCFFDGENYNAVNEQPGWADNGFDDSAWEKAMAVEPPCGNIEKNSYYTIKKHRVLKPKSVAEVINGVTVCNFGENIAGWIRIKVSGARGAKVTVRYAEMRGDSIDTRTLRFAKNTDTYILRGDETEEYEPKFTLHGFSCVEITAEDCRAKLLEAEAYEVYADVEKSGSFWCDNEDINRLHDVIMRTQHAALQSYPIDCPQRDERLGWIADAHVTDLTCMYNMNMHSFYRKWLEDIHLDCHSETGAVSQISPRVDFEHAVDWSTGYAIILWDCYLFYRDISLIEKYYADIERYVKYLKEQGPILPMSRYGDWMSVEKGWQRGKPECCTTLYYYYNILLLLKMSDAAGKPAQELEELAGSVKADILKRFYNAESKLFDDGSQFSQSFALKLGLIPAEDIGQATERLVRNIMENDFHLTTGILGTKYVMEVLSESGNEDIAMRLILQKDYPGWLNLIERKTTLAECWDGSGSQNHCMFGSVDAIFYSMLGGIKVGEEITVRPYFAKEVNHIKCSARIADGVIGVEWERKRDKIELKLNSPAKLRLILPDGRETVTCGGSFEVTV